MRRLRLRLHAVGVDGRPLAAGLAEEEDRRLSALRPRVVGGRLDGEGLAGVAAQLDHIPVEPGLVPQAPRLAGVDPRPGGDGGDSLRGDDDERSESKALKRPPQHAGTSPERQVRRSPSYSRDPSPTSISVRGRDAGIAASAGHRAGTTLAGIPGKGGTWIRTRRTAGSTGATFSWGRPPLWSVQGSWRRDGRTPPRPHPAHHRRPTPRGPP